MHTTFLCHRVLKMCACVCLCVFWPVPIQHGGWCSVKKPRNGQHFRTLQCVLYLLKLKTLHKREEPKTFLQDELYKVINFDCSLAPQEGQQWAGAGRGVDNWLATVRRLPVRLGCASWGRPTKWATASKIEVGNLREHLGDFSNEHFLVPVETLVLLLS